MSKNEMENKLEQLPADMESTELQTETEMQTEETAPMIDMDAVAEKIISIDKYKAV